MKLRKLAAGAVLGLATAAAFAQGQPSVEVSSPEGKTPNRALTLDNVGSGLTAAQKKAAEDIARTISSSMQSAATGKQAQEFASAAQNMARRVDDIANATLSTDRDKVLRFLGINPDGDAALYYFVSFEMPLEVLRAYVVEAMWAGGTLVFKGVPPGRELKDFLTKDLQSLVYGKGASASLSIDPRLFDAYQVTAAPTIVYSEDRKNLQCRGVAPKQFEYRNSTYSYDGCPPIPDNKYWKITGAVTTDYALREFIQNGAAGAQPFHDALAKGLAMGTAAPKSQQPYTGAWKDAVSPAEKLAIQEARDAVQKAGTGVPNASAAGK